MPLVLAFLALSACTTTGGGPVPTAGSGVSVIQDSTAEFTLAPGESIRRGPASVTFVRVTEDSRCPKGVTCVWEGDAIAEIRVEADRSAQTLSLHTNPRFQHEATAGSLRVSLVRLDPYPEADRPITPDAYRAVLTAVID